MNWSLRIECLSDENYYVCLDNYILDNEDVLKETYWRRRKEEWKVEFDYLKDEDKLNFLY